MTLVSPPKRRKRRLRRSSKRESLLSTALVAETASLRVKWSPYIPVDPTKPLGAIRAHPKQIAFLACTDVRECMFGGSAGGGKSEALLMAALQYVDVPGYAAIIFRRTFTDLSLPGAIMDRAHEWLGGTDATWNDRDHRWTFPSGATLTFAYLETANDHFRYQSAEFQYIGFDELTQFALRQYIYLFSRLRRLVGSTVPLRMRSASNPGGIGHEWVKLRFLIEGRAKGRVFIRSRLADNPSLDQKAYIESLSELDPITKAQLLDGDWGVRAAGGMFRREHFDIISAPPAYVEKWVRHWDLAATDSRKRKGREPDWTAGALVGLHEGVWYVKNVLRFQRSPGSVERIIRQTAKLDEKHVEISMEQEPGASGKIVIDHYARKVLVGYTFRGTPSTTNKATRAAPVSSAVEAGNVKLVEGAWIPDFLDELEAFPEGSNDDMVDSMSGAFARLSKGAGGSRAPRKLLLAQGDRRSDAQLIEAKALGLDLNDPKYIDD